MGIRVLIAEPDPALLTSYDSRLSQDGFEVSTATNGLDCLDRLYSFKPRVLVLEPEMPGGDGVLSAMHDNSEQPLIPVFVITFHRAFARLDLSQFPLVTHMQTKPVSPDQLIRLLRHIADEPRPIQQDMQLRSIRRGSSNRRADSNDLNRIEV